MTSSHKESDVIFKMAANVTIARPDGYAELNLKAVRRQDATVSAILATAAHVVVYRFDVATNGWQRHEVEGAFFLVRRTAEPAYGFFVMNRLSLDNFYELITDGMQFQVSVPYVIYRNAANVIHGIWFYDEQEREKYGRILPMLATAEGRARAEAEFGWRQQPDVLQQLFGPAPIGAPTPRPPSRTPTPSSNASVPTLAAPSPRPPPAVTPLGGRTPSADRLTDLFQRALSDFSAPAVPLAAPVPAAPTPTQEAAPGSAADDRARHRSRTKVPAADGSSADLRASALSTPAAADAVALSSPGVILPEEAFKARLVQLIQTDADFSNLLYLQYIKEANRRLASSGSR